MATEALQEGALTLGFWELSGTALAGMKAQLLAGLASIDSMSPSPAEDPASASPALDKYMSTSARAPGRMTTSATLAAFRHAAVQKKSSSSAELEVGGVALNGAFLVRAVILAVILTIGNLYAYDVCLVKYKGILEMVGFPIWVARASAMGALICTALLFFTMSRGLLTCLARVAVQCKANRVLAFLDAHAELHVFSGIMVFMFAALHVMAHVTGTVPALMRTKREDLNRMIGCANPVTTPGYLNLGLHVITWPECPLSSAGDLSNWHLYSILLGSSVGITGVLLVLLLLLLAYTARPAVRSRNFELFWYCHNFLMPLWIVLLFVHGAGGWFGFGLPLVVLVCGVPLITYLADRVRRLLRFYLFAGKAVQIVGVVMKPGKDASAIEKGAMIKLSISKPPGMRSFRTGMYAFINMPEYSRFQWHPFTICSGEAEKTVDFVISAVGGWTQHLAERCMAAYNMTGTLPVVGLDGPFHAPATSALEKKVIVAVGAGVGITPFLSLLSTFVSRDLGEGTDCLEAHFYWMTRSASEWLFGRHVFQQVFESRTLSSKVFLHLHLTGEPEKNDACAFLFRECIKRQSRIDRKAFEKWFQRVHEEDELLPTSPSLPWSWVVGGKQDVLWVNALNRATASGRVRCSNISQMQIVVSELGTTAAIAMPRNSISTACTSRSDSTTSRLSQGSCASQDSLSALCTGVRWGEGGVEEDLAELIPIVIGRPDFQTDLSAIGHQFPCENVHVYVCGNNNVVKSLQRACDFCNQASSTWPGTGKKQQMYSLHFERFGA